jgi:sec-independent protein translocase protein TatB
MFDIGFTELLVIGVVALIVIGPERLPRVARTAGHLVGRLQRYVADVKADINREIEIEELKKMRQSVEQTASGIESSIQSELGKTESELNQATRELASTPAPDPFATDAAVAAAPPAGTAAPAAGTEAPAGIAAPAEKPALPEKAA